MQRLGKRENNASATLTFPAGAVVTAGTYPLDMPYPATVTTLAYEVGSAAGSFTVSITNAGTNITGLASIAVSSATTATVTATAGNAIAAGTRVAFVISAVSGSPTGAVLVLTWQRA